MVIKKGLFIKMMSKIFSLAIAQIVSPKDLIKYQMRNESMELIRELLFRRLHQVFLQEECQDPKKLYCLEII